MAMTPAQKLDKIETAITTILTKGQSYSIEGVTYNRASLKTLEKMQTDILNKVERADKDSRRLAEF